MPTQEELAQLSAPKTISGVGVDLMRDSKNLSGPVNIANIVHPDYHKINKYAQKYRDTMAAGEDFIEKYVVKYSKREDAEDFTDRKSITHCPAHAASGLIEVRNSIFQRMPDILRKGGTDTYKQAVAGLGWGVDRKGTSMNKFMGTDVLDELLMLGRVAIFVDRFGLSSSATKRETNAKWPYVYLYPSEDIRMWPDDPTGSSGAWILRDHNNKIDEETGVITGTAVQYRHIKMSKEGAVVTFYDESGVQTGLQHTIKIKEPPVVLIDITHSLLKYLAGYQVSLVNLASSDMGYTLKANFPFLTEQYDLASDIAHLLRGGEQIVDEDGNEKAAGSEDASENAANTEVQTGPSHGRRYGKGLDRPGFIHPSSEPLLASRQLTGELKEDSRQLIGLALTNIKVQRESADAMQQRQSSKEEGLSAIGMELEHGERQIAKKWADYEKKPDDALINYPGTYDLRTNDDRRKEAKELREEMPKSPSKTYQKVLCKEIARIQVSHIATNDEMNTIYTEIEAAVVVVTDPEVIINDHEAGLLGTKLASLSRGYPPGEAKRASDDLAERAEKIAKAQRGPEEDMASRGVPDLDGDPKSPEKEKKESRDRKDLDPENKSPVRGEGKE